ncbi:MAG: trypsin-like peptidase domain-containing protein [Chthonomonadales bacterium]|nr:trypsin-like peptidase domain-containing protein [Chthonomonadales bacterium]
MRHTGPLSIVAILVIALGGLAAIGWYTLGGSASRAAGVVTPPEELVAMQRAFVAVARACRPAVVSITARKTVMAPGPRGTQLGPFGEPGFPFPGLQGPPVPRTAVGTGSGFIVRPDGYILTNDHVVAGAQAVTVQLDDGREFVGHARRDPRSDLAIVKIDAKGLPTLAMADSSQVKVGHWAIAFGSPFGLEDTMTVGIVSALGREEAAGGEGGTPRFYANLIQTDAAINPGNSGGPLVDIQGRVIGVNVAISTPTGGSVGIGFAIPSNTAKYVLEELSTHGRVVRGFLGLLPDDVPPGDRNRYGTQKGALVASVTEGSPADRAGIRVEDVIVSFAGKPIDSALALREQAARATPGTKASVEVIRQGSRRTLQVTVGKAPEVASDTAPPPSGKPPAQGHLGVSATDLTPEIAEQLRLPSDASGAAIAAVEPGSAAARAGLRPGDLVMRLNDAPIKSANDLASEVAKLHGKGQARMVVRRGNARILVTATLR